MATPEQDPTADYRPYPKGPRFGLIVGLACATLVVIFVIVVYVLHMRAARMLPHRPDSAPNSALIVSHPTQA